MAHPVIEAIDARLATLHELIADAERERDALEEAKVSIEAAVTEPESAPSPPRRRETPARRPSSGSRASSPSAEAPKSFNGKGTDEAKAAVLAAIQPGGVYRRGEVEKLTDLSTSVTRRCLIQLVDEGKLRMTGNRGSARYMLPDTPNPGGNGAAPGVEKPGMQAPTPEGRVLAAIQTEKLSAAEIAERLGLKLTAVVGALGRAVREGDARLYKGDPPRYIATP